MKRKTGNAKRKGGCSIAKKSSEKGKGKGGGWKGLQGKTSSFPALIDIDVNSLFTFNSYFNTRSHVCKLYKLRHGVPRVFAKTFLHAGLSYYLDFSA